MFAHTHTHTHTRTHTMATSNQNCACGGAGDHVPFKQDEDRTRMCLFVLLMLTAICSFLVHFLFIQWKFISFLYPTAPPPGWFIFQYFWYTLYPWNCTWWMAMGQLKIKFVKLGILDSEIEMSQKHIQVSWSRTIGNTQSTQSFSNFN